MAGVADIKAGQAYVELLLKDTGFNSGLTKAGQRLRDWGKGVALWGAGIAAAGAAITGPILDAVKRFADSGERLSKMSLRTGVSVTALSELGYAAEKVDIDIETLEHSLRHMQKTIGEAFQGNSDSIIALNRLGIGLDELRGKTPDQQFERIADSLARVRDNAMKTTLAMQVFGKNAPEIFPLINGGAAGIDKNRREARATGHSIDPADLKLATRMASAFQELEMAATGMWKRIGAAAAETVTEWTDWTTRIVTTTSDWINKNRGVFATLLQVGGALATVGAVLTATGLGVAALGISFSGIMTVLAPVGALLSGVVTPLGVIGALLAGGVAVWASYTEAGQRTSRTIGVLLDDLLGTFRATFQGIFDALNAGDLALAGQIAVTGLKAVFAHGMAAIADLIGGTIGDAFGQFASQVLGGDFAGAWDTAVAGMAAIWDQFSLGIVKVFRSAVATIIDIWKAATKAIASFLLDDAAKGGIMGHAALLGTGVDLKTEQGRAELLRRKSLANNENRRDKLRGDLDTLNNGGQVAPNTDGSPVTKEDLERQIADLSKSIEKEGGSKADVLGDAKRIAQGGIDAMADHAKKSADSALGAVQRQAEQNAANSAAALGNHAAGGRGASHDAANEVDAELAALLAKAKAESDKVARQNKARRDKADDAVQGFNDPALSKEVFGSFSAAALVAAGGSGGDDAQQQTAKHTLNMSKQMIVLNEKFARLARVFERRKQMR